MSAGYPIERGSPQPGDVVAGRYRIEALIGSGGFGGVYRAVQLNLDRRVALKVLHPDLLVQEGGLARFEREAQLAQKLEHPNVVRLYDFGTDANGVPFIAFELLKGESLDRVIARGPLPAARVARIASQVLKALMEAHGLGIVHRDIKPANVFLSDFAGEHDFVKVLDFGIAKSTLPNAQGLTLAGRVLGTPNYMSPESLLGKPPTPAADLYAVGLMMAEALDGQMVIRGESADACLAQISPDPVPLGRIVLDSVLGAVIKRATEKAIERRYATAAEMLRDLEAASSRTPEVAIPPTRNAAAAGSPATVMSPPSASYAATVVGNAAPASPSGSSSRTLVIAGSALGAIALVAIGAIAWAMNARSPAKHPAKKSTPSATTTHGKKTSSDDDDPAPTPTKKKHHPETANDDDDDSPNPPPASGDLDADAIRAAMADAGCTILSQNPVGDEGWSGVSFAYERGPSMGVVSVLNFANESMVLAAMNSLSSEGAVIKRHGLSLLSVTGQTRADALDLLDEIDP